MAQRGRPRVGERGEDGRWTIDSQALGGAASGPVWSARLYRTPCTRETGCGWSSDSADWADDRDEADPSVLMDADREFSAAVASGGSEAWASWFAEDGAMIQRGAGEISGRVAIKQRMTNLDDPEVTLRWEPLRADIARSGDLGWTTGEYVSEGPGPDGELVRGQGRYVSIWRRDSEGAWRVVMDLGNPTGPPGA